MMSLERRIKKYLKARDWDQLLPGDIAKSVAIEAAEVLELFQWVNPTMKELKNDRVKLNELKNELADVFIYALELCVLLGFDSEEVIKAKLAAVEKKYPAAAMRRTASGSYGAGDLYYKIKAAHRRKARL